MHHWWEIEFWGWRQWVIAAVIEAAMAFPLVRVFLEKKRWPD
jgi:hypothetical protein